MAEPRRRRSVSHTFLLDLLDSQLDQLCGARQRALQVVDLGGGTGGVATSLAASGHHVTVVDPSLDALASLDRRTSDAGLTGRIRGVQGDASDLVDIVGAGQADVVICHRVLEVVDSPVEALAAMARVLRPGGVLSLLVSQRNSVVFTQALAGHIAMARRTFADSGRFDHDQLISLVDQAGFSVVASHGIGAVADHVPEALLEAEAGAYAELAALESEISQNAAFRALAPQVHVTARIPPAEDGPTQIGIDDGPARN